MFKRLLASGARGFYRPDLVIHHYVAPERVTRGYFRRWCFWRGVSQGTMDREQEKARRVAYLAGVPRFLYGRAARGLGRKVKGVVRRRDDGEGAAHAFSGELAVWDLAGFFYGKHFYKPAR